MCGIAAIAGLNWHPDELDRMIDAQAHRGPDGRGRHVSPDGLAGLGHNRLKIIDLSQAGRQPMASADGRYQLTFNGEIYNYLELRAELADYPFRSRTDSEVILAAYARWGAACVERFIGMFAFAIWDAHQQTLFAARDRFGVKPLVYHHRDDGTLLLASEIKALHAAGVAAEPDRIAWSTYLCRGLSDYSSRTFWANVQSLPAGHTLRWDRGLALVSRWYALEERVGVELDDRPLAVVEEEYRALLADAIRLRLRSDATVGINLSGGVDSSALLALIDAAGDGPASLRAFTFATSDPRYDELPWVRQMLARSSHPWTVCWLEANDVPALALEVQRSVDEPFAGVPTLAYERLFARAAAENVRVLVDGQGIDEQWAGYDYYRDAGRGRVHPLVQGAAQPSVRPECVTPEFRRFADPIQPPRPFRDSLQNLQYRDVLWSKIPRALRFNDRISMRHGVELREPFLDHRLLELALRQPPARKLNEGTTKWFFRRLLGRLVPDGVATAPKRPLQTPQREWLGGPLKEWVTACLDEATAGGEWLDRTAVRSVWDAFCRGESDNSFYVWQWISVALSRQIQSESHPAPAVAAPLTEGECELA